MNRSRGLLALAVLTLALPAPAATATDACSVDGDAPDTRGEAFLVALPLACEGTIAGSPPCLVLFTCTDRDWFAFDVGPADNLLVHLVASDNPIAACLEDDHGLRRCAASSDSAQSSLYIIKPGAGRYTLEVGGSTGISYTLVVSTDSRSGDCGGPDASEDRDAPTPLGTDECEGLLGGPLCLGSFCGEEDGADVFAFEPPTGSPLTIAFEQPFGESMSLCVGRSTSSISASEWCRSSFEPGRLVVAFSQVPAGERWGISLAGAGPYRLTLDRASPHDDCGSGADLPPQGPEVSPPLECVGALVAVADIDPDGFARFLPDVDAFSVAAVEGDRFVFGAEPLGTAVPIACVRSASAEACAAAGAPVEMVALEDGPLVFALETNPFSGDDGFLPYRAKIDHGPAACRASRQSVQGTFLATPFAGGAGSAAGPDVGADGVWVELDAEATGCEAAFLRIDRGAGATIRFYDDREAGRVVLSAESDCPWHLLGGYTLKRCTVPAGADWAFLSADMATAGEIAYRFAYLHG